MISSRTSFVERRHVFGSLVASAVVLTGCANDSTGPITELRNPTISREAHQRLIRHVNSLAIGPDVIVPNTRIVEIFWSQSCGDTMRAYKLYIKPFLLSRPARTLSFLHLVARGPADIDPCIALRSVSVSDYPKAIRAVLDAGETSGTFVSASQINQIVTQFERGGTDFNSGFAINCLKATQSTILAAGIKETPSIWINGRRSSLDDLKAAL